ncbi:MAG: hypothetical protein Q4D79_08235 [Propionibacteriaceae bacterium]|nr:hypothetical protein [Propionibacteriaceae bacterium]
MRQPGAPTPAVRQTEIDGPPATGAGVHGDILYTTYTSDDEGADSTHIACVSLTTGAQLADRETAAGLSFGTDNVITAWGLAKISSFYAADEWLDAPSTSASPTEPRPTTAGS